MLIKILKFFTPKKIDIYILKQVIAPFLGSIFFILFILIMFQILRIAEYLIVHSASLKDLLAITFYLSVSFLPIALPYSFLISILAGFSRLSIDSELIAMRAHGYSLWRLFLPVFFLALGLSVLLGLLNNEWVPKSNLAAKNMNLKIGNAKAIVGLKEGAFTTGFFDLLFFVDRIDFQKNRLYHVFIFDERESKIPLIYVAKEAEVIPLKSSIDLGSALILRLYDGAMHRNDLMANTYEKIDFTQYSLYLKVSEGEDKVIIKSHMLNQEELIKNIEKISQETQEGRELRGEYWRRVSSFLAPFPFALLGTSFGSFRKRMAKGGSMLVGFLIFLIYWSLQTLIMEPFLQERIPPIVVTQIPNLVALLSGILSFRRACW